MANTIDINKFKHIAQIGLLDAVYQAGDKYAGIIQWQFENAHPTSKDWGQSVAQYINADEHQLKDMQCKVFVTMKGYPEYIASRAHVLDQGNGQIWTKPDMAVYGDDLHQKHINETSQSVHRVPQLQHEGQNVLSNAYKIGADKADDWAADAAEKVIRYISQHIKDCVVKG